MSGHSKWASIKHKKGAADAKRGKVFTKHAKLITLAAREGGDPEMNPGLRTAIDNAKADNVPNNNIERAVKKGTGELKDGLEISELMYEGFGPAGIALYIQVVTDNKNRTVANVKTLLTKSGGTMGEAGSVGWMFHKRGLIQIDLEGIDREELELVGIDSGALDLKIEGDMMEIFTEPTELHKVAAKLKEAGFKFKNTEITFIPENIVKIDDEEKAGKIFKLLDILEEDEDVTNVYSNFDISDEIMEKLV